MFTSEENLSQWAIVELMGRKVVAGKASKSVLFGPPLLRVDVPATGAQRRGLPAPGAAPARGEGDWGTKDRELQC